MVRIESFVCVNFLMNASILVCGARLAGTVRWRRITVGALAGTVYALVAWRTGMEWVKGVGAQIGMLAGMTMIAFPQKKNYVKGFVCVTGCAAFIAGLQTLLIRWVPGWEGMGRVFAVCAAAFVSFSDGWGRSAERVSSRVILRIYTEEGAVEVCALIDTGNTLRETVTGLPVIVVEEKWLTPLLRREETALGTFRKIRYSTLGGGGEMRCFKPKSVCAYGNECWSRCLEAWIALYPGELPGTIGALVPPGVIGSGKKMAGSGRAA